MNRIKEIFTESLQLKPSDFDAVMEGLFQIAFGLWLLQPSTSLLFLTISPEKFPLSGIVEYVMGFAVVVMGVFQIVSVHLRKYMWLKQKEWLATCYWSAITVAWILADPHSVAVVVYGFFACYCIYQYFMWGGYIRSLRYKVAS